MTFGAWRNAARKPFGIIVKIVAEFALVEGRFARRMHEFDRIFQRDDVHRLRFVDLIEKGRERRRLAAAGRAGDQNQARFFLRDLFENGREFETLKTLGCFPRSFRITIEKCPCCRKMLTRKRASSLSE